MKLAHTAESLWQVRTEGQGLRIRWDLKSSHHPLEGWLCGGFLIPSWLSLTDICVSDRSLGKCWLLPSVGSVSTDEKAESHSDLKGQQSLNYNIKCKSGAAPQGPEKGGDLG